jgi:KDO2-lipid IV(A) lauroyltransferase
MGTRLALALVWLLHFLPYPWLAAFGSGVGRILYLLPTERRRVVLTNLALCFPHLDEPARRRLASAHFAAFARSVFDRGIAWWASRERLARIVTIEGWEHIKAVDGRPLILLAPHFVGLDIGGQRLAAEHSAVSMYSKQKSAVFDAFLLAKRNRFGSATLVSRQEGLRPVLRAMRAGLPLYYLPDMDFGPRDSIFVPFFGVPAATIPALGHLVRLTRAAVVPCVTEQLPGGAGYRVRFYPAWPDPAAAVAGEDAANRSPLERDIHDTRRMNAFIEARIAEMPAQYHWLHKRFKTRPPGVPPVY